MIILFILLIFLFFPQRSYCWNYRLLTIKWSHENLINKLMRVLGVDRMVCSNSWSYLWTTSYENTTRLTRLYNRRLGGIQGKLKEDVGWITKLLKRRARARGSILTSLNIDRLIKSSIYIDACGKPHAVMKNSRWPSRVDLVLDSVSNSVCDTSLFGRQIRQFFKNHQIRQLNLLYIGDDNNTRVYLWSL